MAGCTVRTGAPVVDRAADARAAPGKPPLAAKSAPRPTDARPEFHAVRKGDTLYSIALDYGLDYRELAQWNGVTEVSHQYRPAVTAEPTSRHDRRDCPPQGCFRGASAATG